MIRNRMNSRNISQNIDSNLSKDDSLNILKCDIVLNESLQKWLCHFKMIVKKFEINRIKDCEFLLEFYLRSLELFFSFVTIQLFYEHMEI